MSRMLQILRATALVADSEPFYRQAEALGAIAARNFGDRDRNSRSQITGLAALANSALKVTDVLNYIKKQTGKAEPGKTWRRDDFGRRLIEYLGGDLRARLDTLDLDPPLSADDPAERQTAHLVLIRHFIGQLVAHFEYQRRLQPAGATT